MKSRQSNGKKIETVGIIFENFKTHSPSVRFQVFWKTKELKNKTMNEFLKLPIRLYVLLGVWPRSESSKFVEILRYYFGIILVFLSLLINCLQYVEIYAQFGNWESFAENFIMSLIITIVLFKAYVFYTRREDILLISEDIEFCVDEISCDENDTNLRILRAYQKRAKTLFCFFTTTAFFTFTTMSAVPIIIVFVTADYSRRPLVYEFYSPYDFNTTGEWAMVYTVEVFVGFFLVAHMVAFDMFFVTCISFGVVKLKILQHTIETVSTVAQDKLKVLLPSSKSRILFLAHKVIIQKNCETELKKCVKEHLRIITLFKVIDSMLSQILLMVFVSHAVVIGFIGFLVLLRSDTNYFTMGQVLAAILIQLYLYYWHGDELMTESLKVADSVMSSNWYDFGIRNMKTLVIITNRSQKPVLLSVGKFYTVTLQNFLLLLVRAYSYFTILKGVNEVK